MPERETRLHRRQKLLEDLGKTRVAAWVAEHIANPVDQRLLEWSNGRIGGNFAAQKVGLLYNTGAKSGEAPRGAERDAAWAQVSDFYAGYDVYQGRARREIPVVALEPRS